MTGVFVTGTGTEVGKTVVAAVLAHTLTTQGRRVAVFKPAVTGLDEGGEADHELLRRAAESGQSDEEIAPYRYGPPASPHLAAAMAGEDLVRDLAADLGYPLVVVASPGLGTINHTLLTIESARAAGLEIAAVVLTPWPGQPTPVERSNLETIARLGEVEVQALPPLDLAAPATWPTLTLSMGQFPKM